MLQFVILKGNLHESGLQVVDGKNTILLPVHRLRKQTKGLLDFTLFLRRYVMFLSELRLSRLRSAAATRAARLALRRLEDVR